MIIACAWCGKVIGREGDDDRISHGLCEECYAVLERELEILLDEEQEQKPR